MFSHQEEQEMATFKDFGAEKRLAEEKIAEEVTKKRIEEANNLRKKYKENKQNLLLHMNNAVEIAKKDRAQSLITEEEKKVSALFKMLKKIAPESFKAEFKIEAAKIDPLQRYNTLRFKYRGIMHDFLVAQIKHATEELKYFPRLAKTYGRIDTGKEKLGKLLNFYISRGDKSGLMDMLIDAKADVHQRLADKKNVSTLHRAIHNNIRTETIEKLLKNGATYERDAYEPNFEFDFHYTTLIIASPKRRSTIALLIKQFPGELLYTFENLDKAIEAKTDSIFVELTATKTHTNWQESKTRLLEIAMNENITFDREFLKKYKKDISDIVKKEISSIAEEEKISDSDRLIKFQAIWDKYKNKNCINQKVGKKRELFFSKNRPTDRKKELIGIIQNNIQNIEGSYALQVELSQCLGKSISEIQSSSYRL